MSVPRRSAEQIDFCDSLNELWESQSEWSQKTFGSDSERGPIGALKHLEKEAREAYEAYSIASGNYHEELADCFLLLIDACRRSGLSIQGLVSIAQTKHEINKERKWQKPTNDNPVEHLKEGES
jgi:hypothetical protein